MDVILTRNKHPRRRTITGTSSSNIVVSVLELGRPSVGLSLLSFILLGIHDEQWTNHYQVYILFLWILPFFCDMIHFHYLTTHVFFYTYLRNKFAFIPIQWFTFLTCTFFINFHHNLVLFNLLDFAFILLQFFHQVWSLDFDLAIFAPYFITGIQKLWYAGQHMFQTVKSIFHSSFRISFPSLEIVMIQIFSVSNSNLTGLSFIFFSKPTV